LINRECKTVQIPQNFNNKCISGLITKPHIEQQCTVHRFGTPKDLSFGLPQSQSTLIPSPLQLPISLLSLWWGVSKTHQFISENKYNTRKSIHLISVTGYQLQSIWVLDRMRHLSLRSRGLKRLFSVSIGRRLKGEGGGELREDHPAAAAAAGDSKPPQKPSWRCFSFEEIQQATNGFHQGTHAYYKFRIKTHMSQNLIFLACF